MRPSRLLSGLAAFGLLASIVTGCVPATSVPAQPTAAAPGGAQASVQVLRFYFPVGVAGPLAQKMGALVDDFNKSQSEISVEANFSGDYAQTFQKALTAHLANNPPDIVLATTVDVWSLRDANAIIPLDDYIAKEGGQTYLSDFYPGFLDDSRYDGKIWGLPFQKSTPVFYWNKDMFRAAGLDPEKPPQTWQEMLDYAQKLTVKQGSTVTRWGVEIPLDQWLLSNFIVENGGRIRNDRGTETYFDTPEATEALQFLSDLANVHGVMPQKRLFADASQDFVAGQTAMMYNSPGSLAFVRDSAKFPFGVAALPAGKQRASLTGGGQLLIFSKIPDARKQAAWKFATWLTSPENSARWMMDSGYVAVRKSAVEVPALAKYLDEFPQARNAIDAVQYAQAEEPATHDGRKVAQVMVNALEQTMAGKSTPAAALKDAQQQATQILSAYK